MGHSRYLVSLLAHPAKTALQGESQKQTGVRLSLGRIELTPAEFSEQTRAAFYQPNSIRFISSRAIHQFAVFAAEFVHLVAQPSCVLEAELPGRLVHLFLETLDESSQVVG